MDRAHFSYPFICQWAFGLLLLWAILSNAAVNMRAQKSLRDAAFNSFEYIVRGRIALSYGSSSICNFSRNRHTVSQCIKVPSSLHPRLLVSGVFFPPYSSHLNGCGRRISLWLDLHFPDDQWYRASFHGLVGYLCISFGEMSFLTL